jgi:lactoylglutathione lyase
MLSLRYSHLHFSQGFVRAGNLHEISSNDIVKGYFFEKHGMTMKTRYAVCGLLAFFAVSCCALAQEPAAERPHITGISHVAYFVSDLPSAEGFWRDLLGYEIPYDLKRQDGSTRIAFVKINDRQHVELFNEQPTSPPNRMSHICFTVDDIERMHSYLQSKGLAVPQISKTRMGDAAFEIEDPDGMLVEFVQPLPDGAEAKAAGKHEPAGRISTRIMHVGFLVGNTQKSLDFYGGLLGFKETWRGGPDPGELSWINMRVPDGTDYVEFMLYRKLPSEMGGKNHTSLEVSSAGDAVAMLKSRPSFKQYVRPVKIAVGINRKRQVNLFDPDGTRVELMEPGTIDGKPTPPSSAPPPPPAHN